MVNGRRVPDPAAARLQALMPPVSGPPRVPPAPVRQLRPLAWLVAVTTARLTGTGPPAIFTTLGRHPRLFRAWLFYSAHLMPFGTLPRIDSELVILRVAWQCGAAYEWWQHVPLGLRAGLRPEEVAAAASAPPAADLSERQGYWWPSPMSCSRSGRCRTRRGERRASTLTERGVIEVCLLVGHYQGLASAIGGLGIQL